MSGSSRWASNPAETSTQSGAKRVDERRDHVVERGQEHVAGRARRQREVDGRARTRSDAHVVEPARTGVERPLVQRHVHDVGVGEEHVLGAVAVMRVPVDDEDTLTAIAQRRRGDRDVVQQTEAHRVIGFGVMPGRPDRTEGGGGNASLELVDGRQPRARGQPRDVERGRRHRGVEVEAATAAPAVRLELVEVCACVHPFQLGARRPALGELLHRAVDAGGTQSLVHCIQAHGSLDVPGPGVVFRVARIRADQEHRCRLPSPTIPPIYARITARTRFKGAIIT